MRYHEGTTMLALAPCYTTLLLSDGVTGPGVSIGVMNEPVAALGLGLSSQARRRSHEDPTRAGTQASSFPSLPRLRAKAHIIARGEWHCTWLLLS